MLAHMKKALDILVCIAIVLESVVIAFFASMEIVEIHEGGIEFVGQGFEGLCWMLLLMPIFGVLGCIVASKFWKKRTVKVGIISN
jgi:hypothetical protein